MAKCKCGNYRFYAHQECSHDVTVDGIMILLRIMEYMNQENPLDHMFVLNAIQNMVI